jgi:hypothetical protein
MSIHLWEKSSPQTAEVTVAMDRPSLKEGVNGGEDDLRGETEQTPELISALGRSQHHSKQVSMIGATAESIFEPDTLYCES